MPRLKHRVPAYRKHKPSGQAVVTLSGQDFYLGPYGSVISRSEYDRVVGEWQANGRRLVVEDQSDVTVLEVIAAFWPHAERHYRRADGTPTSEINDYRLSLRPLKQLYGHTRATDFGPLQFKTVRDNMIQSGLCRNVINQRMGRVRRMFRWAVENGLVQPSIFHGLQAVRGLQRGRSDARESEPVKPVPNEYVSAVIDNVSPQVAAMIQLQELTGMRPGEVIIMRTCDLDTSVSPWTYAPSKHKTEHHGHAKVIYLGPRAQEIIRPWLRANRHDYLFQPREAAEWLSAKRRAERKSPMTPSQSARKRKVNPNRRKGECYTVWSYNQAIQYGIAKANKLIEDPVGKIPHWHPHQLRHSTATRLRREFDIETARTVLGHRSPSVTEVYAELDRQKASIAMLKVG